MARVKGPFLSLAAAGTFAKTLTFQGRPSGTSVFLQKTPYDVKSPEQKVIRDYIKSGVDYWHKLPAAYISAWNAFVNKN